MKSKKNIIIKFLLSCLTAYLILSCAAQNKEVKQEKVISTDKQLDNLSLQIVASLSSEGVTKIAVIEFSDIEGKITNLGRFIAEELITRLYRTGKFEVIERQLLSKVLKEHSLNMSGIIDQNSAIEIGKILGVDAIATGSLTDFGNSIKINARLINTETGKIFSVASGTITKNDAIKDLMDEVPVTISAAGHDSPISPVIAVMADDIRIEMNSCIRFGMNVICTLFVTNMAENDQEFVIQYGKKPTTLYDDFGNNYLMCSASIANQKQKFQKKGSGYQSVKNNLVSGITVEVKLEFEDVSSQASKITLLDLNCGQRIGRIEFRDIPISSE